MGTIREILQKWISTWSYNDFMAANRETAQNFSYIDFESALCLKLTEHDVATITWPQSAKIREFFLAPGLFQKALT